MLKIYPAVKVRDTFSVSKALGIIKKEKTPVVVVDSRNRYIGMLDARRIREHPVPDPSNTKCSTLAVKAPRLTELTDPLKIANAFFISRFSMLPVVDDYDRVLGLVSRYDLLKLLLEKGMIPKKKVGEVASVPAITIEADETVARAIGEMRKHGVRRLVVTKNGKLHGLLSAFDLGLTLNVPRERLPMMSEKTKPEDIIVESVTKTDVLTIDPNASLFEATKMMIENQVPSLIVTRREKPYGVLSNKDILEQVVTVEKVPEIHISGLDRYDKIFYNDIYEECARVLKKISKILKDVESLTVYIKKYGNKYSVRMRLRHGKSIEVVHWYGWDLPGAVMGALEDLEKRVLKKKKNALHTLHHK